MRKILYPILLLFLFFHTNAQQILNQYSRVKIDLTNHSILDVARLGLEADHGDYAKGKHLINDFSNLEMDLLRQNEIPFEILIEDVKAFYVGRNDPGYHNHDNNVETRILGNCDDDGVGIQYDYETPVNYEEGSMGGYLTYDELLVTLDDMVALYPNLISTKAPIGNILTHENRPIYWLRLSDNPNVEEAEPEVLYTALHHAREPNSLSQMVFYLWYLLENYDSDPEVKYLVDNTAMYFIPCINPDGYIFNENTDPNGGGLWRKNKYLENGTLRGVDLNRNYGYQWGIDDNGSSPNSTSNVYRGTAPFSEPENQAVRDFCNEHQFKITLNYHSYGNLLIYPWGYSDLVTDEYDTFSSFAESMTRENDFFAGTGTQTVGYAVNGNSDDWMYGETDSKPAIYSMTPEIGDGNFGFWPPQIDIDRLNKSTLKQNLTTAHLVLNYGEAMEINSSNYLTSKIGSLEILLKKYGLEMGDLTLSVSGVENITITSSNSNTWNMNHLDEETVNFEYTISNDVVNNEELRLAIQIDNGLFISHDTITKIFLDGDMMVGLSDMGNEINNWTTNGIWNETTEEFYSSTTSYTDSPFEDYEANQTSEIKLNTPIDLTSAESAFLNFYAKWDIESNYDLAQVMGSVDGNNFVPLCGKYTTSGTFNQDLDEPVYEGIQTDWVMEEINLEDYIGGLFWMKFRLKADGGVEGDGFYFDDLSVNLVTGSTSVGEEISKISSLQIFPNPFSQSLKVNLNLAKQTDNLELRLVNTLGQVVVNDLYQRLPSGNHLLGMGNSKISEGIYFLQVVLDGEKVGSKKIVKVK
ncbi:MAG: M14 family zinc carboxypeptidase [Saprospiraceae bacterium]|nr:M14 family zinc carboxypeptidase [Saprospiraceae bacterium]